MKKLLFVVLILTALSTSFVVVAKNESIQLSNTDFAIAVADSVQNYCFESFGTKGIAGKSELLGIMGKTDESKIDFSSFAPQSIALCKDGRFFLRFNDLETLQGCLRSLEVEPCVKYVIQDELIYACEEERLESSESNHLSWGPAQLETDQYAQHLLSTGVKKDTTVAIIDSGAANIEFVSDRLVQGYDFVDNDTDTSNDTHPSSHGTFLSSIVVDCTPDLPVKIMPIRVLSSVTGSLFNVINGIYYAVDEGVDVINVSLGGKLRECQAVDDAIMYAYQHNIPVAVCSGNEHDDTQAYCPAHNSTAITVSAVDSELHFASGFSNFGEVVDVCAPGVDILGYNARGVQKTDSGTSMSAAFISACVAMIKMEYPFINPLQVDDFLKRSTMDLGEAGWDSYYGWGFPKLSQLSHIQSIPVRGIITEQSMDVQVGSSCQIPYRIIPENASDQKVQWLSSDENVVIMSDGMLFAVSIGTANIEVRTNDGGYTAFCKITVHPSQAESLSIVSLPYKLSYTYGEPLDLNGLVLEAKYSDDSFTQINADDCEIVGYDAKRIGDQSVVVKYQEQQAFFSVRVNRNWWQKILRILFFIWLFEK